MSLPGLSRGSSSTWPPGHRAGFRLAGAVHKIEDYKRRKGWTFPWVSSYSLA